MRTDLGRALYEEEMAGEMLAKGRHWRHDCPAPLPCSRCVRDWSDLPHWLRQAYRRRAEARERKETADAA